MGKVKVRLTNLTKKFQDTMAVQNLNLDILEGEFMALVGPSGCGKTTTLNLIAGFEVPDSGQIIIDDAVVNDLEPNERKMGMVFQSIALFPHMTAYDNIAYGLKVKKLPKEGIRREVENVSSKLHISHILSKRPRQMSGGEAQRVALGRCLIVNPSLYLMDEPLANIDAKIRLELRTELKQLHESLGKTFIYVTHDQEEALTMADRIAVMKGGVLQQVGTPDEIYRNPVNRFVADFFGNPPINFINGELDVSQDNLMFRGIGIELAFPSCSGKEAKAERRKVTLGVRPEDILISKGGKGLEARVTLVEPRGVDKIVLLDYHGEKTLITRVDNTFVVNVGDTVAVSFAVERLLFFDEFGNRIPKLP